MSDAFLMVIVFINGAVFGYGICTGLYEREKRLELQAASKKVWADIERMQAEMDAK